MSSDPNISTGRDNNENIQASKTLLPESRIMLNIWITNSLVKSQ